MTSLHRESTDSLICRIMCIFIDLLEHEMPTFEVVGRKCCGGDFHSYFCMEVTMHNMLVYTYMYIHVHEDIREPQLPRLRTAFKAYVDVKQSPNVQYTVYMYVSVCCVYCIGR